MLLSWHWVWFLFVKCYCATKGSKFKVVQLDRSTLFKVNLAYLSQECVANACLITDKATKPFIFFRWKKLQITWKMLWWNEWRSFQGFSFHRWEPHLRELGMFLPSLRLDGCFGTIAAGSGNASFWDNNLSLCLWGSLVSSLRLGWGGQICRAQWGGWRCRNLTKKCTLSNVPCFLSNFLLCRW